MSQVPAVDQSKDEKAKSRRRIIQGLAGAPVIYTLPIGAALAAGSLSCVDKSQNLKAASPPQLLATSPDTWIRVKLQVYKHGSDLYVTLSSSGVSKWYKLTNTSGVWTAALDSSYNGSGAQAQSQYLYGLVDYSGYTAGAGTPYIYPQDQGIDQPVAGASCWNSVTATQAADGSNLILP